MGKKGRRVGLFHRLTNSKRSKKGLFTDVSNFKHTPDPRESGERTLQSIILLLEGVVFIHSYTHCH